MSTETSSCRVCGQPLGPEGRCPHCGEGGHVWTIQDWRPLLTLSLVIVLGFSFTRLVVSGFDGRREALAGAYYTAGLRAMDAGHPAAAVQALESALIYSHDNFQYQLKLTDALLASGATSEAVAQLHSFLAQRPDDAQVNLKLARLEARRHHLDEALRYYLAAIEGNWPEHTDPLPQRIAVRFESAEYLMQNGRKEEAEGALQALAADLPVGWPQQGRLADMFLRNGDPVRALNVYQAELNLDHDDQAAMLGAAKAAVAMASYKDARHYLLEMKSPTEESRSLLAQLNRMEALDPFAPEATRVRTQRMLAVFHIAMERMAGCGGPAQVAQAPATGEKSGSARAEAPWKGLRKWAEQLAPLMNERKARGRDDVIESTMRFAFQVELTAEKECGQAATLDDRALLLLARERLGVGE